MDYGKLTLEELKKGYRYDKEKDAYVCIYCDKIFSAGQIFSIGDQFYVAERAAAKHIAGEHNGNFTQLVNADTKYNTLTQNQKELMTLFYAGLTDSEIARKSGISDSTVRRQRFTFREKAKQARLYLAVYEQVFEDHAENENAFIPIHDKAIYVDDRYLITEQEKRHILDTSFQSLSPLVLKAFSPKEKKKIVILGKIAEEFQRGKHYTEKEVNEILKPVFEDYMTLRRYLVMYGFMERTKDGAQYWLTM
ncbi:DUF2087 domain-containing protein [uncultured Robinsoniella sp.]|uniref:DUF2087 domain-containing protein n=1 Tax=uncultured Robinsoniella sp. TaxID=904190 RepID=UPI00374FA52E